MSLAIDEASLVLGSQEFRLMPSLGDFWLKGLDVGFPEVREVETPNVDRHGISDETAFFGTRPVTISGTIISNRFETISRINSFLLPNLRPELRIRGEGQSRTMVVRASDASAPLVDISGRMRMDVSISFKAPDPRWYSLDSTRTLLFPGDLEPGRLYDLNFDRQYPPSAGVGVLEVNNVGNIGVYPVIRIFGPCTNPKIANETYGKVLHFDNLTIAAGDYLDIRPLSRTIRLNSQPEQNRYRYLNTALSEWFMLRPGKQELRYYPSTYAEPSVAEVTWRSAWL